MIGFEPTYNKDSKVLILGSFPSVKSREMQYPYGHPRNRFWKMFEMFYDVKFTDYDSRQKFLLDKNIALWDIIGSCDNINSSDNNFKNITINDIRPLLPPFTGVKKILCNGTKSYELTNACGLNIEILKMPSTSPANTKFDINIWKAALTEFTEINI